MRGKAGVNGILFHISILSRFQGCFCSFQMKQAISQAFQNKAPNRSLSFFSFFPPNTKTLCLSGLISDTLIKSFRVQRTEFSTFSVVSMVTGRRPAFRPARKSLKCKWRNSNCVILPVGTLLTWLRGKVFSSLFFIEGIHGCFPFCLLDLTAID